MLLLPRGTRANYSYPGYKAPVRFGYFRRSSYNTTLGIFLPELPRLGAWRLIISRHAKWLSDSDRSPEGGDKGTLGSVEGESPVPQADAPQVHP